MPQNLINDYPEKSSEMLNIYLV